MRVREPSPVDRYTLFLSSSDEVPARRLRERIKRIVDDVICPTLVYEYPECNVSFFVDMWERTAAQRAAGNEPFVRRAKDSHLTLVLILDELRPGTSEELEAAAAEHGVEVSVLSFEPSRNADPKLVRRAERVIRSYGDTVFYKRIRGKPNSEEAWVEISRQLFAFVFTAMRKSDERVLEAAPVEVRP